MAVGGSEEEGGAGGRWQLGPLPLLAVFLLLPLCILPTSPAASCAPMRCLLLETCLSSHCRICTGKAVNRTLQSIAHR